MVLAACVALASCSKESDPPHLSAAIDLSTANLSTSEGGSSATFTVALHAPTSGYVTVSVASQDTSEGTVSPSYLYFSAANWNVPQTVTVYPVQDTASDGAQTYKVHLAVSSSSDPGYAVANVLPVDVYVTNADDEIPSIIVSKSTVTVSETGTTDTFTVRLGTLPSADVTIPVTSTDISEALVRTTGTAAETVSLTFTTGNGTLAQTVTVVGQNDSIDDGNQTFDVNVGPATGAPEYASLAAQKVSATTTDDDNAGITVTTGKTPLVTSETGSTATFTVRLNTQPMADITIPVSSGDTTEGLVATGGSPGASANLVFTSANWSTPQTVTVVGQDDAISGDNVTYAVTVGPPSAGDTAYTALPSQAVSVVNIDDEAAAVVILDTGSPLITTEGGTSLTFRVAVTKAPTTSVVVPVTTNDATEGLVMGGSSPATPATTINLTFTSTDWQTAQTVTIVPQADSIDDDNQTYTITVGPPTGDTAYGSVTAQNVSVTNTDVDTAGYTVSVTTIATTEGGTNQTFTVRLNTKPTATVTMPVVSSKPAEALLSGGDSGTGNFVSSLNLTFDAANWATPQTVTVKGVVDNIDDGNQTYTITVGAPSTTDTKYSALVAKTIAGTSYDVDTAALTITPTSGLVVSESGTTASFTVRLATIPSGDVSVTATVNDTSEASISGGSSVTLTFTPATWSTTQTVTVTGVDDAVLDGNRPWTVTLGPPSSTDSKYSTLAARTVTGSTTDNETPANEGAVGSPVAPGTFPYSGQVASGGFSYYTATVPAGGSAYVTVSEIWADVSLAVYSTADFATTLLCSSVRTGSTMSEGCLATATAGSTIYIRVFGAGGGTPFTLNVAAPYAESESNNTIASADGPLSIDTLVSASFSGYSDYDYYAVTNSSASSHTVVFETFVGSIGACPLTADNHLYLFNSSGTQLTYDWHSGVNYCSLITWTIPAGTTYYIEVYPSSTEGYLLQIRSY